LTTNEKHVLTSQCNTADVSTPYIVLRTTS